MPTSPIESMGGEVKVTSSRIKKRPVPLLAATRFPGIAGKLMYFGVEEAIAGDSPGVLFQNADLLQYLQIYLDSPDYLPECIRKKVW